MKTLARLVLPTALLVAGAIVLAAHAFGADGPSGTRNLDGLLKGWYSLRLDSPDAERSLVGVIQFDGNGGVVAARVTSVDNGVETQLNDPCCTYFVGVDGRGTLIFLCPGGICSSIFRIAVADNGRLVYLLREPSGDDERDLSGEMTAQ